MLTTNEIAVISLIDNDQLIDWIRELTQIPSVWRPVIGEGEEAAARWVEKFCYAVGLETYFEYVQPGRPNVIAFLRGQPGGRTLMFEGHTDVVTEGDPKLWRYPPFSAALHDGRIYGRGANDMKGGLVCALAAIEVIKRSGVQLNGDILLGAVCDEEGQMLGIKHFVDRGWADSVDAAIICEPEENHICVAQKGVMWLRATISGVMAHGAMPLTGVNSVYPLARFLQMVHALEEREIARHGRDLFLGQPSITPTVIRSPVFGEPQHNVMPGSAEVILDCRIVPSQDTNQLVDRIEAMLSAVTAVEERLESQLDVIEVRPPTKTDGNSLIVATMADAYRDLTGSEPVYGGVPGSTDGTILNARRGIPIVTCGPGDIHIPHHVDEWISVDEIKIAVRLYVLTAMRFLGIAGR